LQLRWPDASVGSLKLGEKDFPNYASLMNPKPLAAGRCRLLLGADEVLVFFQTGDRESYVFALTRERFCVRTRRKVATGAAWPGATLRRERLTA
jgi:hypothetical protein